MSPMKKKINHESEVRSQKAILALVKLGGGIFEVCRIRPQKKSSSGSSRRKCLEDSHYCAQCWWFKKVSANVPGLHVSRVPYYEWTHILAHVKCRICGTLRNPSHVATIAAHMQISTYFFQRTKTTLSCYSFNSVWTDFQCFEFADQLICETRVVANRDIARCATSQIVLIGRAVALATASL